VSHLIDTHVLVWWLLDDTRLSKQASDLLDDPGASIFVSAASAWELATKRRIGKLREAHVIAEALPTLVRRCRFKSLPVTLEHGHRAGLLPGLHKDPFDRMLAAQSIIEELPLVTADPALVALGASVIW